MALSFDDILKQRQQDALAAQQSVPDALNPNVPGQTTSLNDLLSAKIPPPDAATPTATVPYALQPTPDQSVPDALLTNEAYRDRHSDDAINSILSGVPQEKTPDVGPMPAAETAPEETPTEDNSQAPKEQAEEKDNSGEGDSEDDVSSKAPEAVKDEVAEVENPDNSLKSYKDAHDDYGIDTLQQKQEDARKQAGILLAMATTRESINSAFGGDTHANGLRAQANNELGKAQDYQRLLTEQRAEMGDDMRSDAAGISHQKALMELSSEKSMNDPNSAISTSARAALATLSQSAGMNLNISDKMPYTALLKMGPWVEKFVQNHETQEARKDMAQQRTMYMQSVMQNQQNQKDDNNLSKLRQQMTAANQSSRSAIGRNAQILDSADRLTEFLGDAAKHPDKINSQQMTEYARILDSMLANGASSIGGMTKLTPTTAGGDVAKIQQYLTGNLTGLNQGQFIQQMTQAVSREKALAQAKINGYHNQVLSGYPGLAQRRPDDVQNMIKQFNESAKDAPGVIGVNPNTVTVRRKSDGMTKTLDATGAQKYLSDPNYERIQ